MWEFINEKLMKFESCFSRKAAHRWFVIVVIGLMVRSDNLGLTSIIRALGIAPHLYESLIHFFRATSWELANIRKTWINIVAKCGLLYRVNDQMVLIGDGVKQSKEARKMPCVKKLVQESENSAKPHYIFGHMYGAIGILLGSCEKLFCTLLSLRVHDGNETVGAWARDTLCQESHVVRMMHEACQIALGIGSCILLLDRYYLTVPALKALTDLGEKYGQRVLNIVTRAKKNVVVYEKPTARTGRGRPAKKGNALKLQSLFVSEEALFTQTQVTIYGKREEVSFLVKDLLWGQGLYCELRFVLVKFDGSTTILVSTDTTMLPEDIIELYALRFKIESSLREFKQVIAGFYYHFWTAAMPKLNRFVKNDANQKRLLAISSDAQKKAIVNALKAVEGFAMFSCIAMGLLQMGALSFGKTINNCAFRWLRTKSSPTPSEATCADFLRKTIFHNSYFHPNLDITQIISAAQSSNLDSFHDVVA